VQRSIGAGEYKVGAAMRAKTMLVTAALILIAGALAQAAAAINEWTVRLHGDDIVVGQPLENLKSRHHWLWRFNNENFEGLFDVAVRKSSIPILAPKCRMDYLILTMPEYYPETPKQAPVTERRSVYDALLKLAETGQGSLTVHFEGEVHKGLSGPELTGCNIYFVLPLAPDAAKTLP
jgi:hypothetical protein